MHHSKIHKEKSDKMQQCIKIVLFHTYMKLNMFRVTTAYYQEPKTTLATYGFSYVKGCWTLSGKVQQLHVQQPSTYEKPESVSAVLGS
jgi:hypothetical protein